MKKSLFLIALTALAFGFAAPAQADQWHHHGGRPDYRGPARMAYDHPPVRHVRYQYDVVRRVYYPVYYYEPVIIGNPPPQVVYYPQPPLAALFSVTIR